MNNIYIYTFVNIYFLEKVMPNCLAFTISFYARLLAISLQALFVYPKAKLYSIEFHEQ